MVQTTPVCRVMVGESGSLQGHNGMIGKKSRETKVLFGQEKNREERLSLFFFLFFFV